MVMFSKHCYLCITILILFVVAHHNINIDHQTLIVITQICEKLLLTMSALNHDFVWKEGLLYLFSAERMAGWITESMCSSWMVNIYRVYTIFWSALEGGIPNLCRPTVLYSFKHYNGHVGKTVNTHRFVAVVTGLQKQVCEMSTSIYWNDFIHWHEDPRISQHLRDWTDSSFGSFNIQHFEVNNKKRARCPQSAKRGTVGQMPEIIKWLPPTIYTKCYSLYY